MAEEIFEFGEREMHELREGIRLREHDLELARDYLKNKGLSTEEPDELLKILRGNGPTEPGLKAKLGFREEGDPDQMDIEDEVPDAEGDPLGLSAVEEAEAE